MLLLQDGSSEHVTNVWCKIGHFREKKIEFDDSFDVTKFLQQIEIPYLLHKSALWNAQPSNNKNMVYYFSMWICKEIKACSTGTNGLPTIFPCYIVFMNMVFTYVVCVLVLSVLLLRLPGIVERQMKLHGWLLLLLFSSQTIVVAVVFVFTIWTAFLSPYH